MADSPTAQLRTSLDATRRVVAGVDARQWRLPTPCSDWTVADLLAHLVNGNRMFAAVVRGEQSTEDKSPAAEQDASQLADYDAAAGELLDAFGTPGALERTVSVPFGTVPGAVALHLRIVELLVHGWDLARATGQQLDVPDAIAEQELAFTRTALQQVPPDRSPFGLPQPAPADAGALDQLVALLGRRLDR